MRWLVPAVLLIAGCQQHDREKRELTTEAYVWQHPQRADVVDAVAQASGTIGRFHFLAAELGWDGRRFQSSRSIDTLPAPQCGLVMRIGASASKVDWNEETMREPVAVVRKLAALGPAEIQCDFDCPQRRLSGYRRLLDALQQAAGEIPVVPTALPSWLAEKEFAALIKNRPGYVLQVHSLQLPSSPDEPATLFDPDHARDAARQAARFDVPFRIAMATYGCEVRFDSNGRITDVVSEDPSDAAASRRSYLLADPNASARLVREWTESPPTAMQGIIWYRLPVAGDRRNWPWQTLALVCRGEQEKPDTDFHLTAGTGARDAFVVNRSRYPVKLPTRIVIGTPVSAADGAGAYQLHAGDGPVTLVLRNDVWPWLDPSRMISAGWLRLENPETSIEWHIEP